MCKTKEEKNEMLSMVVESIQSPSQSNSIIIIIMMAKQNYSSMQFSISFPFVVVILQSD